MGLTLAQGALAQEIDAPVELDEAAASPFSFELGVDVVSQYVYRGFVVENAGLIVQPYGAVSVNLFEGEDWLRSIDFTAGIWASLHDGESGSGAEQISSPDWFHEVDYEFTLGFNVADTLTFELFYSIQTSPNGSFDRIQELNLIASWDDSALWAPHEWRDFSGLQPYVLVCGELENQNDFGNTVDPVDDTSRGWYFEAGIGPSFLLFENDHVPVTLSLPIRVGISLADYYEGDDGTSDPFGYVDLGAELSLPVGGADSPWSLRGGMHLYLFGNNLQRLNEAVSGADSTEWVASIGLGVEF